jgi:hypothetical protein
MIFVILILCVFGASSQVEAAGPKKTVNLKLFYEADCPDCRIFFTDQLRKLWAEDKEGRCVGGGRRRRCLYSLCRAILANVGVIV